MLFQFDKLNLFFRFELYINPRYKIKFWQYSDLDPIHTVDAYSLSVARRDAIRISEHFAFCDMESTKYEIYKDGVLIEWEWATPSKEVVVKFGK